MLTSLTAILAIVTVLAIEADKLTQFTHPSLHWIALASTLGLLLTLF